MRIAGCSARCRASAREVLTAREAGRVPVLELVIDPSVAARAIELSAPAARRPAGAPLRRLASRNVLIVDPQALRPEDDASGGGRDRERAHSADRSGRSTTR
jgi:hypothetical protein